MALKIEALYCGDLHLDSSFLVQYRNPGLPATVRTTSFLIHGAKCGPILVDTGYRSPEVMETIGMKASTAHGHGLEREMERRGLRPADVRYIIHTHLHIDHAGKDDIFPDATTVVFNRRELEIGCGGSGGLGYPLQDMKHLVDRVYTPNAAWVLDLEDSGPVELMEHVAVQWAGGHTEGSMNVLIETDEGVACICGDVIYHVQDQLIAPHGTLNFREPKVTGHTHMSHRQEMGAIKRAMNAGTWLLPMHDAPAKVDKGGQVVGRVTGAMVPGPVTALGAGV